MHFKQNILNNTIGNIKITNNIHNKELKMTTDNTSVQNV